MWNQNSRGYSKILILLAIYHQIGQNGDHRAACVLVKSRIPTALVLSVYENRTQQELFELSGVLPAGFHLLG